MVKRGGCTTCGLNAHFHVQQTGHRRWWDLWDRLTAMGGKYVEYPSRHKEYLEPNLEILLSPRAKVFSREGITLKQGTLQQCHANACKFARRGEVAGAATGYAICDRPDVWVKHSWCLDAQGRIVETTRMNVRIYFGFELTPEELEAHAELWSKEWRNVSFV